MFLPIPLLVVAVFLLTGWIFNLVSYFVPYWNRIETNNWGLWQICAEPTGCETLPGEFVTVEMHIGRVFLSLGFISYIAIITEVVLYGCWKQHVRLLSAAAWTSFVTTFFLFLGALCWMASGNTSLSWCYYTCYISGIMAAASGGIVLHVRRQEVLKNIEIGEQQENT